MHRWPCVCLKSLALRVKPLALRVKALGACILLAGVPDGALSAGHDALPAGVRAGPAGPPAQRHQRVLAWGSVLPLRLHHGRLQLHGRVHRHGTQRTRPNAKTLTSHVRMLKP